jgi:hypothetical protein
MMSNKKLVVYLLALIGFTVVGGLVATSILRREQPQLVEFPDDDEVEAIKACLFSVEGMGSTVPEFVVPARYIPNILRAFRPAQRSDYPAAWESETLGRLDIEARSGRKHSVTFCFSGKNSLCFNFDGTRCVRGGKHKPVWVGPGKDDNIWTAECLVLANILREINREASTGERSSRLVEFFEDLERSMGDRPPRESGR